MGRVAWANDGDANAVAEAGILWNREIWFVFFDAEDQRQY